MKNKFDPRHIKRIKNMQALYAWDCGNNSSPSNNSPDIIELISQIDEIIKSNAPKWPLEKINKIDLSILRCALWEMSFEQKNPPKVIIDEAIELAKEFGTESSPSFVNAVLGGALKDLEEKNAK